MAKGKAVTLQAMADQIGTLKREELANALRARRAFIRYDYAEFQRNVMKNELLVDKRTIAHKWEVMCANEIVRKSAGMTYLSVEGLLSAMSMDISDMVDTLADTVGEREGGVHSDPDEVVA